jgi:TPR repeat protein
MFETGQGMPRDLEQAASLYGQACELGDLEACTILGSMYHRAQGVARDLARAVSLHERACEGGEMIGCESLGLLFETGAGVLVDDGRAATLYREACDGGLATACNRLGVVVRSGSGVPADPALALELFARACDGGDLGGCVNLGVGYERGEGIGRDYESARVHYQRACDNGNMVGCVNLGGIHRNGLGVPADPRYATTLYRRACDAGEAVGCFNLGVSYEGGMGVPQDVPTAVALFQRACEGGLDIGCQRLPARVDQRAEAPGSDAEPTFGRVLDAETEAPLPDAIVDLPELGIRLVSDRNGRVDLPDLPGGRHLIRAEATGYAVTDGYLRVPGEADFLVLLEHALVSDPRASGRILGRVTDDSGQSGLSDVDIHVVNRLTGRAISNQQGRFSLDGITPGLAEIRFERLGYEPRTEAVIVQPGTTVDILARMATEPIPLAPIEVVAIRSPYLQRMGFYERSTSDWGTQFGPAEIQALAPEVLSDLIYRVPGVIVERAPQPGAPAIVYSRRRTGATDEGCRLEIYLDGVRMEGYDFDEVTPMQVEALEIYQGLDVPVEYQRRSSQSGCGIVLVWTRRGA